MSDATTNPTTAPRTDMLEELGSLAYGLFALAEDTGLDGVVTLADSRAAIQVPAQTDRAAERAEARHQALLGELGELDF